MLLEWEDVDFKNKTVSISKAKIPNSENHYVVKQTTEAEKSRRKIDCSNYILSRLLEIQPVEEKRKGPIVKMNPTDIYNRLKVISDNNGIKFVVIHGLRHTNASVMLSLGIADKVAMARGGWSSKDTMQNIYQHLFADDKTEADKEINNYFSGLIEK